MELKLNKGKIIALPGSGRSEDALQHLQSTLIEDEPEGVMLITVIKGVVNCKFFGNILRGDLAWAGITLSHEAVRED